MKNLSEILERTDGPYDVVALLSGGKDSVLMLWDILETHPALRILCVTYDDGYLGDHAKGNVERTCQHFGLDNLWLRRDCRAGVTAYMESDLPRRVDIYTFLEVFQNVFWGHVQKLAGAFGAPVVTGNLGYFSSEALLPEQYQLSLEFLRARGSDVTPVDALFVSYWAEESYPDDLAILSKMGWTSNPGLDTDHSEIKDARERLNQRWPKRTLDDVVEERWGELTKPRFSGEATT